MLNVASFFSGAGGFDLGFKKAGFNIVLANDNWKPAVETFKKNFPETTLLEEDIRKITEDQLKSVLKEHGVSKIDVVIGGPPCQCFTRLNNNNLRRDDKRNQLFRYYIKMIDFLQPDFAVMENVADLLMRKDTKDKPFRELIIGSFNKIGYKVSYKVFETEKYGVPQKRRRVIFLATKRDVEISFPNESKKISKTKDFLIKLKDRKRLKNHEFTESGEDILKRIKHIPQGGYYGDLPENLKIKKVRGGKLVTVKRYGSYLRRIKLDEPAITITNNYLVHPKEDRFMTNREKAALHTFPNNFVFLSGKDDVSQQIANAVPPKMAEKIARHILKNYY